MNLETITKAEDQFNPMNVFKLNKYQMQEYFPLLYKTRICTTDDEEEFVEVVENFEHGYKNAQEAVSDSLKWYLVPDIDESCSIISTPPRFFNREGYVRSAARAMRSRFYEAVNNCKYRSITEGTVFTVSAPFMVKKDQIVWVADKKKKHVKQDIVKRVTTHNVDNVNNETNNVSFYVDLTQADDYFYSDSNFIQERSAIFKTYQEAYNYLLTECEVELNDLVLTTTRLTNEFEKHKTDDTLTEFAHNALQGVEVS